MKVKKKVILTLALALFAAMTLLTSTFAWFSIAQSATVGDLQLTVTNGGQLLVSLDGVNYYDNLSEPQFGSYIHNGLALNNVTTSDLENFYNSYEGDEALPNVDYLTFTLYFKCDDPEMNGLYLADSITNSYNYEIASNNKLKGTYVFSEGVNYKTPVTFKYSETETREANTTDKYYAADAVRMGFKELAFDEDDTRTEFANVIYDPSGKEYRGWGVEYGAFDFIKNYLDSQITVPVQNIPDTKYALTTYRYNYYAQNDNSLCATFQPRTNEQGDTFYFAKIQVSIWLEGWDADCFDAIFKDNILLQLYFRTAIKAI